MKKMNKKGFTIVELVIVIAVIAILAGVLIPTFSGVVEKANASSAEQAATNAAKVLLSEQKDAQFDQKVYFEVKQGSNTFYYEYDGGNITALDDATKINNLTKSVTEVKAVYSSTAEETGATASAAGNWADDAKGTGVKAYEKGASVAGKYKQTTAPVTGVVGYQKATNGSVVVYMNDADIAEIDVTGSDYSFAAYTD